MGKGRKPTPNGIKRLRGNPGRAAMPPCPEPEVAAPVCPSHLTDEAKREWNRIVPELVACGVVTRIDRAILAGYCQCWARWVEAEELIAEEGLTTDTAQGGLKTHPAVQIAATSLRDMKSFAAEFGMGASCRTRIGVTGGQKKDDLETFLTPLKVSKSS